MQVYLTMIREYEAEADKLHDRILELNKLIAQAGGDSGALKSRRYKLYQMIWELEGDVRQMREYVNSLENRSLWERGRKAADILCITVA